MTRCFYLFIFIFITSPIQAQLHFAKGFGGQIGLSYCLGTDLNRIGAIVKLYYHYEYVQINVQTAAYWNLQSWGTGKESLEAQLKLGAVAAFGPKQLSPNPFVSELGNQTGRNYSIGYSYNFYWDTNKTTQQSGTFGFGIFGFSLQMENDFLAFKDQDKYRTGAIGIYYRVNNTRFAIQNIAWTADPYADGTCKVLDKDNFPAKYGYREMACSPYSSHSVGILSIGVEQYIGFGQYIGASIGVNAEQIRNMMQNKLIHDSFFLKNPHIPMIDAEGNQYLYHPDQQIRKPTFYLQFLGNNASFY